MASVGRYELRDPIGEGGLARVFRAVDPEGAEVAIKLLRGGADASGEALARFERELRIAQRLEHPHLVRVIDQGVDPALGRWLAMPLVRGMTLRDLFGGAALGPDAALVLLAPLAEALAALHAEGLVHRDVKPENVMLSPLGDLTLVDLGLALGEPDARHPGAGPYLAPEQIEGRDVDPAADVWAFGVMLYELVAGRPPFARERAGEAVAAIPSGTFPPLATIDRRVGEDLDWLVQVCLAPEPWKRPRDGAALLERLRPLVPGARDEARGLRVAVLSDRVAFERRVAARAIERLRAQAREELAAGEALEALRTLDRALAYDPDDAEARALVEQASSGARSERAAPVATAAAPAPPRRGRALVAGLVGALALGAGGLAVSRYGQRAERHDDAPVVRAEPTSDAEAPPDAGAAVATPLDYHPIPPDALSNDDPPALDGVAGPPDGPWVEPTALDLEPSVALARAVRTLQDAPDDVDAKVQLVLAVLALGRNEDGITAGRHLEREHPRDPRALTALGYVSMRRGLFDEADALFSLAIDADARHAPALRHRGVLRVRRGRTRDGYVDLQRALAIRPDDVAALEEMTEVYERAQRPLDAAPFLRRILERRPRHAAAWVSLAIALSGSSRRPDVDEAIAALERGLELAPDHPQGLALRCTMLSRHERAGAVPACTEAIRATPDDPELFMARALDLARRGEHVPALADADRAVELAPDVPRHYANRAMLRARSGDEPGARADLRVACRLGDARSCARLGADGVSP